MMKLRVLLVCEDIPGPALGGLAKHVVALGNALIEAGHPVTLMGRDGVDYAAHAGEAGFNGPFIGGCGDPTRGWKERQLGFWNPYKREHAARHIARSIRARAAEFDVVHYHGHLPMLGRWIPQQINFIQTRHDQGSDCMTLIRFRDGDVCRETDPAACAGCIHPSPGPLRRQLSAWAVRRHRRTVAQAFATHPVVFVSEFLRSNYRRTCTAELPLSTVSHNFVDESRLQKAVGNPASAGVKVHLASRIDAAKGVAAFIELLAPRLPPDWSVDVYGDGPDRQALVDRHAGPRVRFHGHRPLAAVMAAGAVSTLHVVPSVCEESCATVILEALRMGHACYALARGGTPELGRYGGRGQLRLFDSLASLVDGVLADKGSVHFASTGESADVRARLPELLMLYSRRLHSRGSAGLAA